MDMQAHPSRLIQHLIGVLALISLLASTFLYSIANVYAASDLNYVADQYIIVNGMTFTIKNGSQAIRVVIDSNTATFTVPPQSWLKLVSETGRLITDRTDIIQDCNDVGGTLTNTITIEGTQESPRTFTVNPTNVPCKLSTLGNFSQGAVIPAPSASVSFPASAPTTPQKTVVSEATSKADEAAAAAAEAIKNADKAATAAKEARMKADEALNVADLAKAQAEKAASEAAAKKADEAAATALDAIKKADEATTKAAEAKKKAAEVSAVATEAKEKADKAESLAAEAKEKAKLVAAFTAEAVKKADEALAIAAEAKKKANSALLEAQEAQTKAKTAEDKAAEAKKSAQETQKKLPPKAVKEAEEKPVEAVKPLTPEEKKIDQVARSEGFKQQAEDIKQESQQAIGADKETVAQAIGVKADPKVEEKHEPLVANVIEKADVKLKPEEKAKVDNFVTYGTKLTLKLGAGERAGVLRSFSAACDGKLPVTDADWEAALRIANGRFPGLKDCTATKDRAFTNFKLVYKRDANENNPNDAAAINIMQFGLLPTKQVKQTDGTYKTIPNREVEKREKPALNTFYKMYGYYPDKVTAWNVLKAIAYSGAVR